MVVLGTVAVVKELMLEVGRAQTQGVGGGERDEYTFHPSILPSDPLKSCLWWKAEKHVLRRGMDVVRRTFSPPPGPARQQSPAPPAAGEDCCYAPEA